MSGAHWYKRYPLDFINSTVGMSLELKGAYCIILDLIYARGEALPDDPRWLAGVCGVSIRKWKSLRKALIEAGKIAVVDGKITNSRAQKELEKLAKVSRKRAESGAKGGAKRAENEAASLKNNDLAKQVLKQNPSKRTCTGFMDLDGGNELENAAKTARKIAENEAASLKNNDLAKQVLEDIDIDIINPPSPPLRGESPPLAGKSDPSCFSEHHHSDEEGSAEEAIEQACIEAGDDHAQPTDVGEADYPVSAIAGSERAPAPALDDASSQHERDGTPTSQETSAQPLETGESAQSSLPITEAQTKPKKPTPRQMLEAVLRPEDAADVLEHRQRLRKPLTVRAAKALAREFGKLPAEQRPEAVELMLLKGWQGFRAEWFENWKISEGGSSDERVGQRQGGAASTGGSRPVNEVDGWLGRWLDEVGESGCEAGSGDYRQGDGGQRAVQIGEGGGGSSADPSSRLAVIPGGRRT